MMYLIDNGDSGYFNSLCTNIDEIEPDVERVAREYFRNNHDYTEVKICVIDFENNTSRVFTVERVEYFNISSN